MKWIVEYDRIVALINSYDKISQIHINQFLLFSDLLRININT